jgi:hypothetical protein
MMDIFCRIVKTARIYEAWNGFEGAGDGGWKEDKCWC